MLVLGIFNFAIFSLAISIIVAGTVTSMGYSSALRQVLFQIMKHLPPQSTDRLIEGLNIAPISLVLLGSLVAVTSFLGCCGAATGRRWMLYSYFVFVFTMLGFQCAVVGYGGAHGGTIESMAGDCVKKVWGKSCECVDGPDCKPSPVECFTNQTLPANISTMCQPCEELLVQTVCRDSTLHDPDACAHKVEDVMAANIALLLQLFVALIILEALCIVCAIRIAKWSLAANVADRDEESLLADAYKANRTLFRVSAAKQ